LIYAIADLSKEIFDINIFPDLTTIPHFNPDLDNDQPPAAVIDFRSQLREAEGILICTPEYAMGVPGTLKNAIDWTVSSGEFSHKPMALITASSSGEKAHRSLLETLKVIESEIPKDGDLVISFVKTKVNSKGEITDQYTVAKVEALIKALDKAINDKTTSG